MILQKNVHRAIYMGLVSMGLLFNSSIALAGQNPSSTSAIQEQSCTHLCSHACLTCRQSADNYGSTLALDESDNGKSFTIKPGAYVTVTLEENPSTGYHWENDTCPSARDQGKSESDIVISCFELLSHNYTRGISPGLGGGGIRVFVYAQISIGYGRIKLNHVAPDRSVSRSVIYNVSAFNANPPPVYCHCIGDDGWGPKGCINPPGPRPSCGD